LDRSTTGREQPSMWTEDVELHSMFAILYCEQ
jgi:hypothetical protein